MKKQSAPRLTSKYVLVTMAPHGGVRGGKRERLDALDVAMLRVSQSIRKNAGLGRLVRLVAKATATTLLREAEVAGVPQEAIARILMMVLPFAEDPNMPALGTGDN